MKIFLDKGGNEVALTNDEQKNLLCNIEEWIPRYAAVKNNNGYSYTFKQCMKHCEQIPDGYISVWDYEHYSFGWASGSNYYAVGLVKL